MKKIVLISLVLSTLLMGDTSREDAQRAVIQNIVPNSKFLKYEKATELDGFFRVYFENGQILYINPIKETIVFGEVWDKKGHSYTMAFMDKWKEELSSKEIKNVSIKELIQHAKKAVFNEGSKNDYSFVLFTDPECPYCKTVEKFFADNNSTVYFNFTPLPFHKNAKEWSEIALSSKDFKKTLEDIHAGNIPNTAITEEAKKQLDHMEALGKELKISGTPKIFIIDEKNNEVVGVVNGADIKKLESFLRQK